MKSRELGTACKNKARQPCCHKSFWQGLLAYSLAYNVNRGELAFLTVALA